MPVVERARPAMEAVFAAKIVDLVERSRGKIRADVARSKLVALGLVGGRRRRALSRASSWRCSAQLPLRPPSQAYSSST